MQKYNTVDGFLNGIDENKKQQVLKIREYIFDVAPELEEHIKWNAPSYVYNGEDRITFNLLNKESLVKLVFHMGVSQKENKKAEPILKDAPLIEWASDIRGFVTFTDLGQIIAQEEAIKNTIVRWLAL